MKMIFAVIQPTKLDAVHQALERLDVTRMTVCDAQGYARQRGQLETYRGHEYKTNLLRKVGAGDRRERRLSSTARSSAWKRSPAPAPKATSATARSSSCRWTRRSRSATATAAKGPSRRRAWPCVLLSGDLMGASRVEGAARLAGVEFRMVGSVDAAVDCCAERAGVAGDGRSGDGRARRGGARRAAQSDWRARAQRSSPSGRTSTKRCSTRRKAAGCDAGAQPRPIHVAGRRDHRAVSPAAEASRLIKPIDVLSGDAARSDCTSGTPVT